MAKNKTEQQSLYECNRQNGYFGNYGGAYLPTRLERSDEGIATPTKA